MISVCVPIFRYDVRPLARELLRQAAALPRPVELLLYDDASPDDGDWGRTELRTLPGLTYVELTHNLGRAAIRNRLARDARHEHILLMDADGRPGPNYLAGWLTEVERQSKESASSPAGYVVSGGRTYAPDPPADKRLHLHWWYGTCREAKSAAERMRQPYLGFQSNNFLANRGVLLRHPFPEHHRGYGHEDTLWGQELRSAAVGLRHLDNPTVHLGLEPADVFLRKQREALSNLALLRTRSPHLRTRLIDLADRWPLAVRLAEAVSEIRLTNYLTGRPQPKLLALDILKMKWWGKVNERG